MFKQYQITGGTNGFNFSSFLDNVRYSFGKIVSITTAEGETFQIDVSPRLEKDGRTLTEYSEMEIHLKTEKKLCPWLASWGLSSPVVSAVIESKLIPYQKARWESFGYKTEKIGSKKGDSYGN